LNLTEGYEYSILTVISAESSMLSWKFNAFWCL